MSSQAGIRLNTRFALSDDRMWPRAEANALFREGDVAGAAAAYSHALEADEVKDEDKLALLANLSLCRLRLTEFGAAESAAEEALRLGAACYANPGLAAKAAGRLLEARRAQVSRDDEWIVLTDCRQSQRAAIASARFYLDCARVQGSKAPEEYELFLPKPPSQDAAVSLLRAIGAASPRAGFDGAHLLGVARRWTSPCTCHRKVALCWYLTCGITRALSGTRTDGARRMTKGLRPCAPRWRRRRPRRWMQAA